MEARVEEGTDTEARAESANRTVVGRSRGAGLALFGAGLGVLAACLADFAGAEPPPTAPGDPVVWVADREASRVYGLDLDLYLSRRIPVDWPLEVEPAPDGGTWVLRSETGTATSTHRLDRLDAGGAVVTELWIERALDLDVLADGEHALVIEQRIGYLTRLLRVRTEGSLFQVLERDGLTCVVGERDTAVAGTSDGKVVRVHALGGSVVASASLGGRLADLAPGPEPGMVWALDDSGNGRVVLLAADLSVRWSAILPRPAGHLAAVSGEERVWLANTTESCVLRFGPGGALELDRCGLPLPGLDRALAWRGGVLVSAVGAILRLDRDGNLRPGQGGFDFVADLAPSSRRN